ncbi:hypothetical protein CFB46_08935 [Burkholderia sp. HI2761]|nr:hypothetical protein CFB46_08935 [Burkholderia sp. HI2761]
MRGDVYEADTATAMTGRHKANIGLAWHDSRIMPVARRYAPCRRRAAMPARAGPTRRVAHRRIHAARYSRHPS